ncbi:hypothetical protein DIPPA_18242 [Diplonema papillatum]|nr:hypothetical protein DIPPA_18242 [Diplonema papillatum]
MNTAMLYAAHAVLTDAFSRRRDQIDSFLTGNGLDVHSPLKSDPSSPVGIGAAAGEKVVEARRHDGMNSVGDHARERNFEPFSDTTGYRPVNTAHALNDASRWQPDVQRKGQGVRAISRLVG